MLIIHGDETQDAAFGLIMRFNHNWLHCTPWKYPEEVLHLAVQSEKTHLPEDFLLAVFELVVGPRDTPSSESGELLPYEIHSVERHSKSSLYLAVYLLGGAGVLSRLMRHANDQMDVKIPRVEK